MAINVNKINQNTGYNLKSPKTDIPYSALKMAYTMQATGDMGKLYPVHTQELLPGQKVSLTQDIGIQFNPFVSNLMHQISGEVLHYFVPNRLTWPEPQGWETFITGGIDGQDATAHPTISLKALYDASSVVPGERTLLGTLADYFGMPISHDFSLEEDDALKPSALYWRAYNLAYNEHLRVIDVMNTPVPLDNNEVLRGFWDWDYFTRARVYQQRGLVPTIPVSDELQTLVHEFQNGSWSGDTWSEDNTSIMQTGYTPDHQEVMGAKKDTHVDTLTNTSGAFVSEKRKKLRLMPHSLTELGMNINDLLLGMAIMRYEVNNAKIQPRYIEQLEMRFDMIPQDVRLNRPEYIGSQYFNVATDTITQTSEAGTTPQGHITGQAWGNGENLNASYEAKEHGILLSLMVIKPKPVYEGGLNRKFIKRTRFDYATPELVNVPNREIYRGELMYTGTDSDLTTFGWTGIYEEYRTFPNIVAGRLRPSIDDNLVTYTLARFWEPESPPILNQTFLECNPDQNRILAITSEPAFIFFVRNSIRTALPLPIQSEPGDLANI